MRKKLKPYGLYLNFESGELSFYNKKVEIKLSDLKEFFSNREAVESKLIKGENPSIYSYYDCVQPPVRGEMSFGVTRILPGKIGDEYNHTRGHYHTDGGAGEIYVGIKGEGFLLLQKRDGSCTSEKLERGRVVYAPADWNGHRTVNTGKDELVFLTIEQADSGHDYETIKEKGFAKLVVERNGKPVMVDNSRYK